MGPIQVFDRTPPALLPDPSTWLAGADCSPFPCGIAEFGGVFGIAPRRRCGRVERPPSYESPLSYAKQRKGASLAGLMRWR